jgi:hypothetical protein
MLAQAALNRVQLYYQPDTTVQIDVGAAPSTPESGLSQSPLWVGSGHSLSPPEPASTLTIDSF